MVTKQLSEGMMFKQLNRIISINILDFNIINRDYFHNKYNILNEQTGHSDNLLEMFDIHYIESKKFTKDYNEISNALDRWITFLTKASKLDKRNLPKHLATDPLIVKAVSVIDRMFDEEERDIYSVRLQAQMDFESKIDSAYEKGTKEGIEKEKKEIAKNLLINNVPIGTIIKTTGLTKNEIENLK
jgi:predicted transposase/invertase (TIGR01784 family)